MVTVAKIWWFANRYYNQHKAVKLDVKYFLIAFLVLETLLNAVFVVLDLMLFYIFFESVLIPLFLIVGIRGGSDTRIRAAFLLFLYTLGGSLFMLLAIMVSHTAH
jgi:NADH-ubiquinone oxidoreductase chain 4